MNQTIQCDIAIIGAGSGGLSIAAVASQLGLRVVLVEEKKMGGECLNSGCVPSKALLAAAHCAHVMLNADKFGVKAVNPIVDFAKVMDHVAGVINTIAPNDSIERFTNLGVQVIQARGEFIDEKTLRAGEFSITARKFVIATGSSPAIPPIPGIASVAYLTNESIFDLRIKPEHLLVIGAGAIGCELAQAFSLLGVKVTIIEAFKMMPRDEPDLVAELKDIFAKQGIKLYEDAKIVNVEQQDKIIDMSIEVDGKKIRLSGSHVLIAAGRKINIDNLHLENAKIAFTPKNISVDAKLRTSNKRVYAIGDVVGPYQFTHMANYQASVVIKNIIFKQSMRVNYQATPWVTYTIPELAHVGLTYSEALAKDSRIKTITVDLVENDRAQTERNTRGKIKLIVDKKAKILGVSILAANAGDLILPWVMLIKQNQTLRTLTDTIVPYPTLSEISKRAASEFYKPLLFSKTARYLVSFLKHF